MFLFSFEKPRRFDECRLVLNVNVQNSLKEHLLSSCRHYLYTQRHLTTETRELLYNQLTDYTYYSRGLYRVPGEIACVS